MANLMDSIFNLLRAHTNRKESLDLIKLIKVVTQLEIDNEKSHQNLTEKHDYFSQLLFNRFNLYQIDKTDQHKLIELTESISKEQIIAQSNRNFSTKRDTASKKLEKLVISILGAHETILDYCSGEGSFLIEYGKRVPNVKLIGIEKDLLTYENSMINLTFNDLDYQIFNEDALTENSLFSQDHQFDRIYSNFPINLLNQTISYNLEKKYLSRFQLDTKNSRDHDWNFVEHVINLLSEKGKAVIVVPLTILFREAEVSVRHQLLKYRLLESVIQLPERMLNYAKIPVALMVLSQGNEEVTFIDATELIDPKIDETLAQHEWNFFETIKSDQNTIIIDIQKLVKEELPWIPRNLLIKNEVDFPGRTIKELSKEVFRGAQILKSEYEEWLTPPSETESMKYKLVYLSSFDEKILTDKLVTIYTPPHQYDRYLIENNDILMTSRGTLFKMALASVLGEERLVATGNIAVIRADPREINPVYLYLFLKSDLGQRLIESIRQGSTIYILNNKDIEYLKIKEVSKEKQDLLANRYIKILEQKTIIEFELSQYNQEIQSLFDEASDL